MSTKVTVTEDDRSVAKTELINDSNLYLREVEDAYEEGFRAPYCFHGTNLWTDYDPICGYCEDGAYDPRYHKVDGPEFNDAVEVKAHAIARRNRFNTVLDMIKDDAKLAYTRGDLVALKFKIDYLLELEN